MQKRSILVVDDEVTIRKALHKLLENSGYQVTSVKDFAEAEAVSAGRRFDLVLCDLSLPDGNGLELIDILKKSHPDITSIVITGNGSVESAIEATKKGVFHYVTKPFLLDEVLVLVRKALKHEELQTENQRLKQQLRSRYTFDSFIGDSPQMTRIFELIEKVADTDSTVLISGESGTGKELVARALHFNSNRSEKMFVPVNCGAIPAGLLESELFGHIKGAFTGAVANRTGRFQAANGGTIFLDEIGEMPSDLQVKLLRVLQLKQFEPVGSVKTIETDARIVAATNIDLEQAVIERSFREDLYYRLNIIPIVMPPLRARRGDIPLLIHHFMERFNQNKHCDVHIKDESVMNRLIGYDWPGNVRELENLVQRMVILKGSGFIGLEDLPRKVLGQEMQIAPVSSQSIFEFQLPDEGVDLKQLISRFEDQVMVQALERTNGNKNKASELLRMNRTTLVERLKKKQINYVN